jgi:hypothetical protein
MTCPDCHSAWVAGLEQGRAERITAEIPERARAMLLDWSRESLSLARESAAKVGPNWTALVMDSAERND